MKIYKTQAEVEADIVEGVLDLEGQDVRFECSIRVNAAINARDINAKDINAWDINAWDINVGNINAWNINAWNISANNVNAGNINALDINARDISANNVKYYAFCNVYQGIECDSITGERVPHNPPVCLDGELTVREPKTLELTMDEIADKYGVNVKDLKIKTG